MLSGLVNRLFPNRLDIDFASLSEHPDPQLLPPLDRPDVDESKLTSEQLQWRRNGVLVLPKFLPDDLIDAYVEVRQHQQPSGWPSATPYLTVPTIRDLALYRPLTEILRELIGEEMLLHLILSGWISSERTWHQDDYLNPPQVNSWYAAVWMALDDIHPDSGPFEYVEGSHRWPLLRGEKVRKFLTEEEHQRRDAVSGINQWPKYAERFVTPAVEAEVRASGARVVPFIANRGDVLIWHGRLMHRGSMAKQPGLERRSLIAHYSGVNHRPDMPMRRTTPEGSTYAVFS